ncbi:hypothetical protein AAFO92_12995 [Roseovarius sp. CAU 1744]|uniref:hypothetical protein n=1 Tax=Roseovarius sp. CAU 1744 TaxID=3140368 RepID=UPI00325BBF1D
MNDTMSNYAGFEARLKKLDRKRTRMAHGYKGTVDKDGLIVFRPARRQRGIPLRAIVLLVVGFFVFKGMVMAHTGSAIYDKRVAALNEGTLVEQAGAFMMQSDPITVGIAQYLRPFLQ